MQRTNNYRTCEYYTERLEMIIPQLAEQLAKGRHIEIAPSRSGIKIYTNDRRYILVKGMRSVEGGDLANGS